MKNLRGDGDGCARMGVRRYTRDEEVPRGCMSAARRGSDVAFAPLSAVRDVRFTPRVGGKGRNVLLGGGSGVRATRVVVTHRCRWRSRSW
jgi:hypothetical protein